MQVFLLFLVEILAVKCAEKIKFNVSGKVIDFNNFAIAGVQLTLRYRGRCWLFWLSASTMRLLQRDGDVRTGHFHSLVRWRSLASTLGRYWLLLQVGFTMRVTSWYRTRRFRHWCSRGCDWTCRNRTWTRKAVLRWLRWRCVVGEWCIMCVLMKVALFDKQTKKGIAGIVNFTVYTGTAAG